MKNKWFILLLLAFSPMLRAQSYFQKIYQLGDSTSIFGKMYVTDSLYYLTATVGYPSSYIYTHLTQINTTGQVEKSSKNSALRPGQFAAFSQTRLDTNYRGNLVMAYGSNIHPQVSVGRPRITEFDLEGNVVFDYEINDYEADSLFFFPGGSLVSHAPDSTYYVAFPYINEKASMNVHEQGVLFAKLDRWGNILFHKKFRHLPLGLYTPKWIMGDLFRLSDTTFLLYMPEISSNNSDQDWCKTHFYTLGLDGTELKHVIFQDTQNDGWGNSVLSLTNGDYLYSYMESKLVGTPPADYFQYKAIIARINSTGQILWKDTLNNFWGNYSPYNISGCFIGWSDTSVLHAYEYLLPISASKTYIPLRIENRHLNGEVLWYRDYMYYDTTTAEYQIMNAAQTPQGDLLFAGQVINYDLKNAGLSYQNAYLLKTNCLGFMGSPKAGFYLQDEGNGLTRFVNTSLMAGSFVLDWGDGTQQTFDERTDTLYHTYSSFTQNWPLRLIAKGCGSEADTLDMIWNWVNVPENAQQLYFEVLPNPLAADEQVNVSLGQLSGIGHELEVYDMQGRMVTTYGVPQGASVLTLPPLPTAGTYFLNLTQQGRVLQSKQLVRR